jgi:hypothetical protein
MRKPRKNYTPVEKVAILRRHTSPSPWDKDMLAMHPKGVSRGTWKIHRIILAGCFRNLVDGFRPAS